MGWGVQKKKDREKYIVLHVAMWISMVGNALVSFFQEISMKYFFGQCWQFGKDRCSFFSFCLEVVTGIGDKAHKGKVTWPDRVNAKSGYLYVTQKVTLAMQPPLTMWQVWVSLPRSPSVPPRTLLQFYI